MVTAHKHFLLHEEIVKVGPCIFQQGNPAKHKNKGPEWKVKKKKGKERKEKKHTSLWNIYLFSRILDIYSLGTFSSFSIKNLFLVINSATLAEVSEKLNFI